MTKPCDFYQVEKNKHTVTKRINLETCSQLQQVIKITCNTNLELILFSYQETFTEEWSVDCITKTNESQHPEDNS